MFFRIYRFPRVCTPIQSMEKRVVYGWAMHSALHWHRPQLRKDAELLQNTIDVMQLMYLIPLHDCCVVPSCSQKTLGQPPFLRVILKERQPVWMRNSTQEMRKFVAMVFLKTSTVDFLECCQGTLSGDPGTNAGGRNEPISNVHNVRNVCNFTNSAGSLNRCC